MDLKKLNPLKFSKKIKNDFFRKKFLDFALTYGIPFNIGIGLQIDELSDKACTIKSPSKFRRRNHIGTAHAISQALIGEYAAGLLISQKYDFDKFRYVISNLNINYHKAGVGTLKGTCKAPHIWPELVDGVGFIEMYTEIKNEKGDLVSDVKTTWQIKSWTQIPKR